MSELISTKGGVLLLEPQGSWEWKGFDGKIPLKSMKSASIGGGEILCETDLVTLITKSLPGKRFTSTGFADMPGTVISGVVTVNSGSLSNCHIGGDKMVTENTEATVILTFIPAFRMKPQPILPDPSPKSLKVKIEKPGQNIVTI